MTSAVGSAASSAPGTSSLEWRTPEPMSTVPRAATPASMRSRQSSGTPTGVMPPYSMPLISTARSTGRKEALWTSMSFLTTWLTSAKSVARTTQAATRCSPARLPATRTQLPVAAGSRR